MSATGARGTDVVGMGYTNGDKTGVKIPIRLKSSLFSNACVVRPANNLEAATLWTENVTCFGQRMGWGFEPPGEATDELSTDVQLGDGRPVPDRLHRLEGTHRRAMREEIGVLIRISTSPLQKSTFLGGQFIFGNQLVVV